MSKLRPARPLRVMVSPEGKIAVEWTLYEGILPHIGLQDVLKDLIDCVEEVPGCTLEVESYEDYGEPGAVIKVVGYRDPTPEELGTIQDMREEAEREVYRKAKAVVLEVEARRPDWVETAYAEEDDE